MLHRVSTIRGLAAVIVVTIIIYSSIFRLLLTNVSSRKPDGSIGSASSISKQKSLPTISSILPQSSMYNEMVALQVQPIKISPTEIDLSTKNREYITNPLTYDDSSFRQSSVPILWIDAKADVRWNRAAENGILKYFVEKQFPNIDRIGNVSINKQEILDTCRSGSLFLLQQHWSGFFSRVLCFIAQFGQTLYSPRIAVLRGTRFSSARGESDDFLNEGIKRYFLPFSICSAYEYHPDLKELRTTIGAAPNPMHISRTAKLYENANVKSDRSLLSDEYWKMDYHHVPIRKWLFDRKKSSVSYDSPISVLVDHSDEHIYAPNNAKDYPIGDWINTNKPDAFSSDLLPNGGNYKLTWQDYVFGSFLRYMFVLFFGAQNAPRIETSMRILAQFWSNYLTDKYSLHPNANVFDNLAGIYVRRGDKSSEDSFWHKHRHWRNISYYVKGVVDEEKRRNKTFKYIFVMTDDVSVMNSFQDYASAQSPGSDEAYARKHLRGREILYNVLAPQSCFDPFRRIGFEQFLVSMRFLIEHAAYTVGHTDSNVFRFFREIIFARRQHNPNIQSSTYLGNAPDSFGTDGV